MLMNKRRKRFKFTEKKHSKRGMITSACALILLLIYVLFVTRAFKTQGNLSTYYGSVGVLAMLFSLVALGFAISSLFDEDSFRAFPHLAVGLSLVSCVCWIGTYVAGFMI